MVDPSRHFGQPGEFEIEVDRKLGLHLQDALPCYDKMSVPRARLLDLMKVY